MKYQFDTKLELTMWIVVYSNLFSSSWSKIRQCSSMKLTTGVFHLGLFKNVIRQSNIQSCKKRRKISQQGSIICSIILKLLTCSPSTTGSWDAFCAIFWFTCTNCGQSFWEIKSCFASNWSLQRCLRLAWVALGVSLEGYPPSLKIKIILPISI